MWALTIFQLIHRLDIYYINGVRSYYRISLHLSTNRFFHCFIETFGNYKLKVPSLAKSRVHILTKSAFLGKGGINSTWKKQGEIQSEKYSNKLPIQLWFMDIFPVFNEFLTYFSCLILKIFRRFAPIVRSSQLRVKKMTNSFSSAPFARF